MYDYRRPAAAAGLLHGLCGCAVEREREREREKERKESRFCRRSVSPVLSNYALQGELSAWHHASCRTLSEP